MATNAVTNSTIASTNRTVFELLSSCHADCSAHGPSQIREGRTPPVGARRGSRQRHLRLADPTPRTPDAAREGPGSPLTAHELRPVSRRGGSGSRRLHSGGSRATSVCRTPNFPDEEHTWRQT